MKGFAPIPLAGKLSNIPPPAIIFQRSQQKSVNDSSTWYRFNLENRDALTKRWLIKFRTVPHKKLDLFIPTSKGYELKQFGVFSQQQHQHNKNIAPINLPAVDDDTSRFYYIRIDSPYPNQLTPELWPESVYTLEQYKTFTLTTSLQAIMALLLVLTLVKGISTKKTAHILLASHVISINALLLFNQNGLFHITPTLADPGHWLIFLTSLTLITAIICYQQTARLPTYIPLASRLTTTGCFLSISFFTGILALPAHAEPLMSVGVTATLLTVFALMISLGYCSYQAMRPPKHCLMMLSVIASSIGLSLFIEVWPRTTITLFESSILVIQALLLTAIYWYHNKPEFQKAAAIGIVNHTSSKRRVFETALRQHLQKPDTPLKMADIPTRILSTLIAVMPDMPASVITCKGKKWSVEGSDNSIINAFKKQLPALQPDIKAVINANEDSQIHLKDGTGSTYWLLPLDAESSNQTVLMLAPVKPHNTSVNWHTACDIASHARTLYQASKQSRYWETQASLDPLTRLLNRLAFSQEAERYLLKDHNNEWPHCCLLFLDLDNFKSINDQQGHGKGDEVLSNIARLCTSSLRQQDLLCRYGGEEFAVLLPGTEPWQAWQVAERIRQSIERSPSTIGITVSIGLASFGEHTPSLTQLLKEADAALYEAKRRGKNQIARAQSCKDLRLPT